MIRFEWVTGEIDGDWSTEELMGSGPADLPDCQVGPSSKPPSRAE